MSTITDVRPSPIAGQWYEGNPRSLARQVDEYLNAAKLPALDGEVLAVIAPHAGHIYSGAVAGYSFAALRGQSPELVAVISPMHQPYYEPLITTAHDAYFTPLGIIPVDKAALSELDTNLKADLGFGLAAIPRDREHSLEIELPFLQRVFQQEWKLLPIMVRGQDPHLSQALGKALANVLRSRNFALVASTDLSHFYEQKTADRLDAEMLRRFESLDPNSIFEAERTGTGFACGHAAVAAVLWAAQELGATKVQVLHHATSGDVTGDHSSVVGYGAAVVLK
ncbi:MAG: AmmeMemoRadiSam system protein B [Anaerolineales bacterium]